MIEVFPGLKHSNPHTTTPRSIEAGLARFASKPITPPWRAGGCPHAKGVLCCCLPPATLQAPQPWDPSSQTHSNPWLYTLVSHMRFQLWSREARPPAISKEAFCSGGPSTGIHRFPSLWEHGAEKCLLPSGYPPSSKCRIQRGKSLGPSPGYDLLLCCLQRKESS